MAEAQINGVRLFYLDEGSGPPVVLVAGLSAHSGSWVLQRPALAEHFRVISIDNRGAGQSDVPSGPNSLDQMAADIAGLLDHLSIPSASVVGVSMGGMVAQVFALSYAERLNRLVLVSTAARPQPHVLDWLEFDVQLRERGLTGAGRTLWWVPWVAPARLLTQPGFIQAAVPRLLSDPYPPSDAGFISHVQAVRAFAAGDTSQQLHSISASTLILVGDEDILTTVEDSRFLAEHIPNSKMQVFPGGAHGVLIHQPEAVNAALLSFLS